MAKNALLVDDSRSARYVLGKLLQDYDFNVAMVDSAEAALEYLRDQHPDAIFMDHQMPGMSGLEAVEHILANPDTAHIPVVMCSANEEPDFIKQVESWGSIGILPKPPTKDRLLDVLARVDKVILHPAVALPEAANAEEPRPQPKPEVKESVEHIVAAQVRKAVDTTLTPLLERRVSVHAQVLSSLVEQSLDEFRSDLAKLHKSSEAKPEPAWVKTLEGKMNDGFKRMEQRLGEHMETRLSALREDLVQELASDPHVFSEVRKVAEGAAELVSGDNAGKVAYQVATETAQGLMEGAMEDHYALLQGELAELERRMQRRSSVYAMAAAILGLTAAVSAWLLA